MAITPPQIQPTYISATEGDINESTRTATNGKFTVSSRTKYVYDFYPFINQYIGAQQRPINLNDENLPQSDITIPTGYEIKNIGARSVSIKLKNSAGDTVATKPLSGDYIMFQLRDDYSLNLPDVKGQLLSDAITTLEDAGYQNSIDPDDVQLFIDNPSVLFSGYRVDEQNPNPGTAVKIGSPIILSISLINQPPTKVQLPNIIGKFPQDALVDDLQPIGLTLSIIGVTGGETVVTAEDNYTSVITRVFVDNRGDVDASTGTLFTKGATVYVDTQYTRVAVPRIVGLTVLEAFEFLATFDLKLKVRESSGRTRLIQTIEDATNSRWDERTIDSQDYDSGAFVVRGAYIGASTKTTQLTGDLVRLPYLIGQTLDNPFFTDSAFKFNLLISEDTLDGVSQLTLSNINSVDLSKYQIVSQSPEPPSNNRQNYYVLRGTNLSIIVGRRHTVPNIRNLNLRDAFAEVTSKYFLVNTLGQRISQVLTTDLYEEFIVTTQTPDPGSDLAVGSDITIDYRPRTYSPPDGDTPTLPDPTSSRIVPSVVGEEIDSAESLLLRSGFIVDKSQVTFDAIRVSRQLPLAGTRLVIGSTVRIFGASPTSSGGSGGSGGSGLDESDDSTLERTNTDGGENRQ